MTGWRGGPSTSLRIGFVLGRVVREHGRAQGPAPPKMSSGNMGGHRGPPLPKSAAVVRGGACELSSVRSIEVTRLCRQTATPAVSTVSSRATVEGRAIEMPAVPEAGRGESRDLKLRRHLPTMSGCHRSGMASGGRRSSSNPSCRRSGLAEGARHSPTGLPLPSVCSMSTVSMPSRANSRAALAPAGPPPSTATVGCSDGYPTLWLPYRLGVTSEHSLRRGGPSTSVGMTDWRGGPSTSVGMTG